LIEISTMLLVLLQFYAWGLNLQVIPILLAVPFLLAALLIDWDHMILPDDTNIAVTILAVAFVAIGGYRSGTGFVADHVIAAVMLFAVIWGVSAVLAKIKGRTALGRGDLKFLPAAGLFLGTVPLSAYMILAGALGLLTALIMQKNGQKQVFPFGPALIISLYIHVFLTGLGFDYKW